MQHVLILETRTSIKCRCHFRNTEHLLLNLINFYFLQTLHKAINKHIEKEVILQAGKNNTGLSYLTKPAVSSDIKKQKHQV